MKSIISNAVALGLLAVSSMQYAEAAMKKEVTFQSNGQTLVGDLYLPETYQKGDKLPGVVVSGSWTSVKEQMPGTYAQQLADKGYATLAFDFRGWGTGAAEAPAQLQYVESPTEKTKDILAAIDFMATRSEVQTHALATLGICASAGYAIDAATQSDKVSSIAVVAPWLHDAEVVEQVYGENIPALLEATELAKGSEQSIILEAASNTNAQSVMYQIDYYTNPERGAIPEYDNKFNALSWEPWLTYDAIQTADKLHSSILLVHSDAAAIPQGAKKFAAAAGDKANLVLLDEITQFDFYDDPEAITTSVELVNAHFKQAFNQ